ncbi:flagellar hook-basal body complex protein [Sporomusa sp.]|uniref:flagellar hook protein FlgE n=1 Tax=Sporomusa sp. TaxID=2078658 RepID=UPI002C1C6F9F|nr:flagellar hook-basal body complex protein [Sporomusa sp.]HWR44986.1 flagellar hook-basal body complex protein [Sporomusa sp.]
MMTSIYSGVSGLKAQQKKLDVIGNNISNVSTTGYKSQTVSFADLLSQTISGSTAANATTGTGGTNAKQIGTGVSVAATTTNMTTGSTQSTGNSSDVSISGSGFFIVQGGGSGEYQFTRAGNFGVDSSGNLTVNGYKVSGWMDYTTDTDGNYTFNTETSVEGLNLFSDSYNGNKKVSAPAATTEATISGSVDASADAQGTITKATMGSTANATTNATALTAATADATSFAGTITINKKAITIASGDTIQGVIDKINAVSGTTGVTAAWNAGDATNGYIQLNGTTSSSDISLAGANTTLTSLFAATTGTETTVSVEGLEPDATTTLTVYDSLGNSYDVAVNLYKSAVTTSVGESVTTWYWEAASSDSGLSLSSNSGTIAFDENGKIVDDTTYDTSFSLGLTPTNGAAASTVTLDLSQLSSYTTSSSDSLSNTTDGYASGELEDFTIGSDGIIYGVYSNGQTQPLGMIALANFANASGLEKIGSSLYVASNNSGAFTGGVAAGTSGTGALSSGTLEMSNVDLSEQFSEMMITQRAYQANSKIISAADEILKAAINMVG